MKKLLLIIGCLLIFSACKHQAKNDTNKIVSEKVVSKNKDSSILITYKQPVNGYKVKVVWVQNREYGKTADFYLNDTLRFTVEGWIDVRLYDDYMANGTIFSNDTILDYIPKKADEVYWSDRSPFFFSDVDFDGEDEFLVNLYDWGTYGSSLYTVYEPKKGFELKDELPFNCLQSEQCVFDEANKTIAIAGYDFTYFIYQKEESGFELIEQGRRVGTYGEDEH